MKLSCFLLFLIVGFMPIVNGQAANIDSLIKLMESSAKDTVALNRMLVFSNNISFSNPSGALQLDQKTLYIAKKYHYSKVETDALNSCGEDYHFLGYYANALKMQFDALQINRDMNDLTGEVNSLSFIGIVYNELGQYRQALQYLLPAYNIVLKLQSRDIGSFTLSNIGDAYYFLNKQDSALYYQHLAFETFSNSNGSSGHLKSYILNHTGDIYAHLGKNDSALMFYRDAIANSRIKNDKLNMAMAELRIASLYKSLQQNDSSFYYAHSGLHSAQSIPSKRYMLYNSDLLASLFQESKKIDSAFFYLKIAVAMRDSIYGPEKFQQLQVLMLKEQQNQEKVLRQQEQFRNKIKYEALLSGLIILFLLAFLLWQNNQHKKKANNLLQHQKKMVENTLSELKSTQSQLIQSEKMASLGELTAGIAHEIQNPLNFVNNFSEVNTELLAEMKDEMDKGNTEDAKAIANDVIENEQKINHHGKRAGDIVKGMLQHSRTSTGVKEPTNINALADEYLRLSYHGLRAKDKEFNATMKTDFDESIGKINIIPQDIGRVLLNLYNNAFYACTERSRSTVNQQKSENHISYDPTVSVTTKKSDNHVIITVSDNGNGIPQNIVDKIFQPFFTTKPTGSGTGLGLSLSYDIIKAHGGEIKVESTEGKGSEFIIQLPI